MIVEGMHVRSLWHVLLSSIPCVQVYIMLTTSCIDFRYRVLHITKCWTKLFEYDASVLIVLISIGFSSYCQKVTLLFLG